MRREPKSEDDVKDLVLAWYKSMEAWHYANVQTAMGIHGIPDRLGSIPLIVTPEMVGKKIGLFVSVEAKRPGRRGEKHRGMKQNQFDHMNDINATGGIAICCDGREDLSLLDRRIYDLITVPV